MTPRRDDERRPVDFVESGATPAPAAPGDELSTSPPRRGGRWYLALSAAVLVGAAVIAGKVSGNHTPSPSPPPTAAASSLPSSPALDPAQCPGPTTCTSTGGVPEAAAAALLDAFPAAHLGMASTVYVQTGGLWFREITARAGLLDILVRVEHADRGTPVTQSGSDDAGAFVQQLEGGFLVQVQVDGPRDRLPSVTQLSGLAGDGRLLTLG